MWSRAGFAAGATLVALCTSMIASGGAGASTTTTIPAASTAAKTASQGVCAAPTTIDQEQCQVFLQNRAKKASDLSAADTSPLSGAYTPADLQSAYDLATAAAANGAGTTISIVDAYRDPNIVTDLAAYRSEYGLPACDSTTGEGCVATYSETGGNASSVPVDSTGGWEVEESLDVDMVSAICPLCHRRPGARVGAAVGGPG